MTKINLIIATRNRLPSLLKTLASVPDDWVVHICCDGDHNSGVYLTYDYPNVICTHPTVGSVAARNILTADMTDGCLYGADDIIFQQAACDLLEQYNATFPNGDGVLGLRQLTNHGTNGHPAAFALVGQRFLERYDGQQLFWPGFYHFACQEVMRLAQKVGRWAYTQDVIVLHKHPADQTTNEARIHLQKDHKLIKQREKEEKIWGFST